MSVKMRMPKLMESLSAPLQTDTKPYLLKPVPIGNRERLKLIGGTVAVNQLSHSSFSSNIRATTTVSGTSTVIKENRTSSNASFGAYEALAIPNGHKVFLSANVSAISVTNLSAVAFYFRKSGGTQVSERLTTTSTGRASTIMALTDASLNLACLISNTSAKTGTTDTVTVQDIVATDLTQMFGSTIADYAYTLEQGHAGDGIAWLKSFGFFNKDFFPFDSGSLLSVKTSKHVTTGKNLNSYVNGRTSNGITFTANANGSITAVGTATANAYNDAALSLSVLQKGYPWLQKGTYIISGFTNAVRGYYALADANGTGIGSAVAINTDTTITLAQDCYLYIRAQVPNGTTVNETVYPMIRYASVVDGTYEPYKKNEYPLSDIELRGIPKLVSGAIEYDGDSYEADGTVTRRYGIVDLGTLTWTYSTSTLQFRSTTALPNAKVPPNNTTVPSAICAGYEVRYYSGLSNYDKAVTIIYSGSSYVGQVWATNSAYTNKDAFKTAMSGVYLVYELATPTTETADAYENPQIVETGGTESFVDGRTVEMPVGNVSEYCDAVKSVSIGMRMGTGLSVKMRMGGAL